jgi:lysyl-tRNA synthetase class 2
MLCFFYRFLEKTSKRTILTKTGLSFSYWSRIMKKETDPNNSAQNSLSGEHVARLEKVKKLAAQGINAWPAYAKSTVSCSQVIAQYQAEKDGTQEYEAAGRLIILREHGKTIFAKIQDRTGQLQVYIRQDVIGDQAFTTFKELIDVGDFLRMKGVSFKTKTGEITLRVQEYALISKCLYPLPEKFHGLVDIETIYRQRYLDLISNEESRKRFIARSTIVRVMREILDENGFIEVETPMLHPIPGGALARPFVTHHNALAIDLYLRIAPELYLKRLVVGGLERVYEINRNFRNEGISTRHNPEFTMLEFYAAYQDYHFMMDFVETMLRTIVQKVCNATKVPFGDKEIDFGAPFARLSMKEAVQQYGKLQPADLSADSIDATMKAKHVTFDDPKASWGQKLYVLFEALVEPHIVQPTYITHFPIEVSPLAKRDANDPTLAARFELFVGGMELSNGFNELNDPFDQKLRFEEQARAHSGGNVEAHRFDAEYIQALEYGLPPTVGCGIGIDRLTMLATHTTSIKDVILFPTLKPKKE